MEYTTSPKFISAEALKAAVEQGKHVVVFSLLHGYTPDVHGTVVVMDARLRDATWEALVRVEAANIKDVISIG